MEGHADSGDELGKNLDLSPSLGRGALEWRPPYTDSAEMPLCFKGIRVVIAVKWSGN
jgi:hypothetical protein